MTLTAVLTRSQSKGFTAEFKELPEFLVEGVNDEEALRKLITEFASYLTWRAVQELRAAHTRALPNDALEVPIV